MNQPEEIDFGDGHSHQVYCGYGPSGCVEAGPSTGIANTELATTITHAYGDRRQLTSVARRTPTTSGLKSTLDARRAAPKRTLILPY